MLNKGGALDGICPERGHWFDRRGAVGLRGNTGIGRIGSDFIEQCEHIRSYSDMAQFTENAIDKEGSQLKH